MLHAAVRNALLHEGPDIPTFSLGELRSELANQTSDQKLFDVGEKADATEAFIYILESLHSHFQDALDQSELCDCVVHKACHTQVRRIVKCNLCKIQVP